MIICKSLTKTYGDVTAISDLEMTIDQGAFIGLLGPNGAGKTTLIRMMIGLLRPTSGQVLYDGAVMHPDAAAIKSRFGVVSQHINLDKELSVEENLIFAGKLYQLNKERLKSRVESLLIQFGLERVRGKLTKKLSGGMKRKLMIAKALIHQPQILFLDEPTVGIDVQARQEIWQLLKSYHEEGKTIILTTHYIEEAEHLCQKVIMISEGTILKEDSPTNMIDELGKVKVVTQSKKYFFNNLADARTWASQLLEIYKIEMTTLEDVFLDITGDKEFLWL